MSDRTSFHPRGANRFVRLSLAATLLAGLWSLGCGRLYPRLVEPLRVDEVFTPAELAAAPFPQAAARLARLEDGGTARRRTFLAAPGAFAAGTAVVALLAAWRGASARTVAILAAVVFVAALTTGGFNVVFVIPGDDAVAMSSVDAVLTPAELKVPAMREAMYDFGLRLSEARQDEWLFVAAGLPLALAGLVGVWAIVRDENVRRREEPMDLFDTN